MYYKQKRIAYIVGRLENIIKLLCSHPSSRISLTLNKTLFYSSNSSQKGCGK